MLQYLLSFPAIEDDLQFLVRNGFSERIEKDLPRPPMGWVAINHHTIHVEYDATQHCTLPRGTESRPGLLSCLVVFHGTNVNEIAADWKSEHSPRQLRQNVKPDISWHLVRNHIEHLRRANHYPRKCQVASRICRFLHKLTNHAVLVRRYNAATARIGNFIYSKGCRRLLLEVSLQHPAQVGVAKDVGV